MVLSLLLKEYILTNACSNDEDNHPLITTLLRNLTIFVQDWRRHLGHHSPTGKVRVTYYPSSDGKVGTEARKEQYKRREESNTSR